MARSLTANNVCSIYGQYYSVFFEVISIFGTPFSKAKGKFKKIIINVKNLNYFLYIVPSLKRLLCSFRVGYLHKYLNTFKYEKVSNLGLHKSLLARVTSQHSYTQITKYQIANQIIYGMLFI